MNHDNPTQENPFFALMIDDDPDDFLFIKMANKKLGHKIKIDHIDDGSKALSYLQNCKSQPDFILLDINMPIQNGKETLKSLKRLPNYSTIKIFMLSTSSLVEDKTYCLENGADDFFQKACDIQGYVTVLERCLQKISK